jgi:hypothetical protein
MMSMLSEHALGARLRYVWLVLVVTTALLLWRYPDQAWVLLSKLNRVALGGVIGVGLDRAIFWYARPDSANLSPHYAYRRAVIVAAGMLSAALAV